MGVVTASGSALVPPSDEQLIACFRRGNQAALDQLFQRYRAVAYRVAYRVRCLADVSKVPLFP